MFDWVLSGKVGELLAPVGTPSQQLLIAIQTGQQEKITELMDGPKRVSATCCNEKGVQPIHAACQAGNQELVTTLLELGASLFAQDTAGNGCLHYAAKHGKTELVKWLTRQGVPVGLRNNARQSAYDVGSNHAIRQFLLPLQLQEEAQNDPAATREPTMGAHRRDGSSGGVQSVGYGGPAASSQPPPIMSSAVSASHSQVIHGHGVVAVQPPPGPVGPPPSVGPPPGAVGAPPGAVGPPPPIGPPPGSFSHRVAGQGPVGPPPPAVSQGGASVMDTALPDRTSGILSAPSSMHGPSPLISTPPNSMPVLAHKQLGSSTEYRPIKADGFHTSASDKQLQKLYGHGENTKIKKNLAPPPIFGKQGSGGGEEPGETVPPPPTYSYTAYTGGRAATPPRYVSYDAVTNTTSYAQPPVWNPSTSPPPPPSSTPPPSSAAQAGVDIRPPPTAFQPVYVFNPSTDKVISADSASNSVL